MEEDNKLKPRSYKIRNNMETTLHVNKFKFHKPGNEEITQIVWRIDSYKI